MSGGSDYGCRGNKYESRQVGDETVIIGYRDTGWRNRSHSVSQRGRTQNIKNKRQKDDTAHYGQSKGREKKKGKGS